MPLTISLTNCCVTRRRSATSGAPGSRVHPGAMDAAVQPGGRLPTVGKLIDHIFLVERRHVQRLRTEQLSTETGLTGSNAPPFFDYGASVRRELEHFTRTLGEDEADEIRSFEVRDQTWQMTPRKLLFHILVHETTALGADCAGRPARRPRTTRRPRSVLQQGAAVNSQSITQDVRAPVSPVDSHRPWPLSSSTIVWISG